MARSGETIPYDVRDAALAWFVRLQSGDASESDRADHAAWMAADARHRVEYGRVAALWSDLDALPDPRKAACPATTVIPMRRKASRRAVLVGGLGAVAASTLAVMAVHPGLWPGTEATGTGERRHVGLPDGSTMELDAKTAVAVEYSNKARRLHLLEGRAFFDVAADGGRPFVVRAASGVIQALGTRFSVHEGAGRIAISVEDSAVSVSGPGGRRVTVAAGQRVAYDHVGLGPVEAADLWAEAAWRRGKLVFQDQPLGQVIADVNRYRSGTIRVLDDALLGLRVSGIFDVRNPDGVLEVIRATLPVRVVELTDYLVFLRAA